MRLLTSRPLVNAVFKSCRTLLLKPAVPARVAIMAAASSSGTTFESLQFDNLALKSLPIDPIAENYVREVKGACFSKVTPTPLKNPKMVAYSADAMKLLDLEDDQLNRAEAAEYLSGNKILPGSETASHCYCGHQFGLFAGQLGDGAAIYLGEIINKKIERWEIQLKGAGLTPYSRSADGRKVLRSTIREFLASEAMHYLGVPTTRAGSCIVSDSTVVRDIFYDGHPILEKCAVVLRIAETFIRFGSFEIFKGMDMSTGSRGPSFGRQDIQTQLLDYVVKTFYAEALKLDLAADKTKAYEQAFEEIVKRTAKLVAGWQCVGFTHGVLNTDNMSIYGLTIDYGPYGFLDRYNPDHIFNGSDTGGRYTLRNQPDICKWNCNKLSEALHPVLDRAASKAIIDRVYDVEFKKEYLARMRKKLGLKTQQEGDENLINEFHDTMIETQADFTNAFRKLSLLELNGASNIDSDIEKYLKIILAECSGLSEMKAFFKPKFPKETLEKLLEAMAIEPEIVSYLGLSESIVKNQAKFMEKFEAIKSWTDEDKTKADSEAWKKWLKSYLKRIYDEIEQSKSDLAAYQAERVNLMNANNPRFILRNHLLQEAIEKAEIGLYDDVKILLTLSKHAFSDQPLETILRDTVNDNDTDTIENLRTKERSQHYERPPEFLRCVKLTCSS